MRAGPFHISSGLSPAGLTGVGKTKLYLWPGPCRSVIPSAARNLKSITTRPDSHCRVYLITNNVKQRKSSLSRLYLRTGTSDSSTPLRCAQNDSDRVAFSSMESGAAGQIPTPISPAGERGLRQVQRGERGGGVEKWCVGGVGFWAPGAGVVNWQGRVWRRADL